MVHTIIMYILYTFLYVLDVIAFKDLLSWIYTNVVNLNKMSAYIKWGKRNALDIFLEVPVL